MDKKNYAEESAKNQKPENQNQSHNVRKEAMGRENQFR